jgi:hypothetical protein
MHRRRFVMIVRAGERQLAQRRRFLTGLLAAALIVLGPAVVSAADEQAKRDDRPARGIAIYSEFSGVVVPVGESVRMDLTVENKGGGTRWCAQTH